MINSSSALSLFAGAGAGSIPHGVCLTWNPALVWTLATSHLMVGLAYLAIPLALIIFIRRQRGLRFNWMFALFGAFIFACGATHFIALMNIWRPNYGLEAIVMAITATVSVATAVSLTMLIPVASNFLDQKAGAEQQLHKMNLDLQDQMERFFDLAIAQRQSKAELIAVQDASPLGQFRANPEGGFTYVNRSFERISGWPAESLMDAGWKHMIHPDDLDKITQSWLAATRSASPYSSRHRVCRPDGTVVWVSVKAAPVQLDDQVTGYVGSLDDVTALHDAELARKAEELRLRALSLSDSLTHLGNRAGFEQALQAALDRRTRVANPSGIAVLFADLDRLKYINDTLGHATGDALIQGFATRLQQVLRVTDYCARWGGDEFTVVMENVHGTEDLSTVCEKLLSRLQEPFHIGDRLLPMTASFGVACHIGKETTTAEELVKQADDMLYAAKREGRNTYRIHPLR